MDEKLLIPTVTEASWNRYQLLRKAPLEGMKTGVLPNIISTINKYQELALSLSSEDGGGYTDIEDQQKIATYHPIAIARVAPAISSMIEHMQAVVAISAQVDAAFVEAGQPPLFGVS